MQITVPGINLLKQIDIPTVYCCDYRVCLFIEHCPIPQAKQGKIKKLLIHNVLKAFF